MKTHVRLIEPYTAGELGPGNYIGLADWNELPTRLQPRMDKKGPVFRLLRPVAVEWDLWRFEFAPDFFFDLSSIPLSLRAIGVSRFYPGHPQGIAALVHDAWWRGLIRLAAEGFDNARMGTRCYVDISVHCNYSKWRAAVQKRILELAMFTQYKTIYEPDESVVTVRERT